ncbi:uncharacterized protein P884DRAFT_281193 [Thermothelomyces heterothallicus CBS 202.75]|uniref:uncharacterized protein n=1 Tax=Thermothelomyces heterothallicus CBS 202.75 TaxID=1149848 RepID=UPI0037432C99
MLWDKFMWYAGSDGSDRHHDSEKRLCFFVSCRPIRTRATGADLLNGLLSPTLLTLRANRPPAHLVPGPLSQAVWQAYDSQPFSQTVEVTVATWTSTDVTVAGCVTVV